jgi:hypothetical protein
MANPPSQNFLIFFEGGQYCFDNISCGFRSKNTPRLMTSKGWGPQMEARGILNLREANVVFINYCTSDDHVGNSSSKSSIDWEGKPVPYIFEGGLVVKEVLEILSTSKYGLGQAKLMLLTGTSSGGVAVHPWADRIQGMFPRSKVVVFSDSGFFLDPKPFHVGKCFDSMSCSEAVGFARAVIMWKPTGNMDDDCENALGPGNSRCLIGPHVMPYITSRWMTFEYQFDVAQLKHFGIYNRPPPNSPAYTYIMHQAANLTNILRSLEKTKPGGKLSFISPSCYKHGVAPVNKLFMKFKMNNGTLTIADIVGEWLADSYTDRTTVSLVDSCRWPSCNPSCDLAP